MRNREMADGDAASDRCPHRTGNNRGSTTEKFLRLQTDFHVPVRETRGQKVMKTDEHVNRCQREPSSTQQPTPTPEKIIAEGK